MTTASERRSGMRIVTRVPTQVRSHSGEHPAEVRDVSSSGVFLYTKYPLQQGAEVELVLILPPELTSGGKCWVCCQATVVRVEERSGRFGIAAKIRRMDVLPEAFV